MAFFEVFGGGLAVVAGKKFYDDALQPGAKEVGQAIAAAVRVIRAAGIGPEQAVELRDDLIAFVGRAVRRVPEANRVEPPPQILGPILEQLRYEPIDTPVAEMLEAILAGSMDKDRLYQTHPAFVQIARELVSDEVRLLRYLTHSEIVSEWEEQRLGKYAIINEVVIPAGLLQVPDAFPLYYTHLNARDLCIYRDVEQEVYEPGGGPAHASVRTDERKELMLTNFGKALMKAADLSTPSAPSPDVPESAPSA